MHRQVHGEVKTYGMKKTQFQHFFNLNIQLDISNLTKKMHIQHLTI